MKDERTVKYEKKLSELKNLSDEELKNRFWALCNKATEPLVELSQTYTSPSIERSVLMRMGFDSITSSALVSKINEMGYLAKGAGHVVLKYANAENIDIKKAAQRIIEVPEIIKNLF